jgi:signal transduction histidine kinase
MPSMMPPEPSATQKAMEAAAGLERERRKKMEVGEATMNADELRMVMKQERQRMTRAMADLAALKATNVQSQLEAEVVEEGRINGLMRRLDHLQQEKGRLIVELEREEEMVRYFYRITRW